MCEVSIIRKPNGFERYDLVNAFLRLRKQVFIDRMKWPLFQYKDIEFEQYDSFAATYVIAHDGDAVLGGARLIRTDEELGSGKLRYSYMIRDAFKGHLPGMPSDICFEEPPESTAIWELTRLATVPGVDVARDILLAANRFLAGQEAQTCLFLGPPAFMRMARSMGFSPKPIGPIVRTPDGSFLAFACDVVEANLQT